MSTPQIPKSRLMHPSNPLKLLIYKNVPARDIPLSRTKGRAGPSGSGVEARCPAWDTSAIRNNVRTGA
ncbi:hypothetical protein GCM10011324_30950 [Allosediminivita pacifica]|nr:hypothetical protein GCM10011324_30950 [Allosediminivita pacifica]